MRRAAIYARYSTDRQDERSIADQTALAEAVAAREQLAIVARYSDAEKSSASLHGRAGVAALIRDARAGAFDVLIVECLDRLSRSQADLPWLYERLTFAGIAIIAADEGPIDELRIGVRAITGPIALRDVRNKVHRGMTGVVREGRHAGGRAYGYRPVPGRPGELAIEPAEAAIVARIYKDFIAGMTPRAIAAALNRENVPPPRGRRWTQSSLNGSSARSHGILRNAIYAGTIVWNRVRMVKNPDTGKRVSRPNPEDEWQRAAAPALAIVDAATWTAAQQIKNARARPQLAGARALRRPKRLLAGLLTCGSCGGALVTHDRQAGRTRMRCAAHRDSGTCANARLVCLEEIEARVLAGLKRRLQEPKFLAAYVAEYAAERRRLAADATRARGRLERRAGEIERELARAVDAIVKDGVPAARLRERMIALEAEAGEVKAALAAAAPPAPVALHPGAIERYRADVARLQEILAAGATPEDLALIDNLRALVARVIVTPRHVDFSDQQVGRKNGFDLEIEGRLAALIEAPGLFPSGFELVAEEGLEPPTHGL
jgi:site-specific DNA recombinase